MVDLWKMVVHFAVYFITTRICWKSYRSVLLLGYKPSSTKPVLPNTGWSRVRRSILLTPDHNLVQEHSFSSSFYPALLYEPSVHITISVQPDFAQRTHMVEKVSSFHSLFHWYSSYSLSLIIKSAHGLRANTKAKNANPSRQAVKLWMKLELVRLSFLEARQPKC